MPVSPDVIPSRIFRLRGLRVILDADLARLYGVPTFRLNEAAKRNAGKFPEDFRFQVSPIERSDLISQIAISSASHGGVRKLPWVYTEHGALMAANVLRSPRATEMAIYVVRAFVKQRESLASNAHILRRLAEIDKSLLEHDAALQTLWRRLQPLLAPPPITRRRKIGFYTGSR